MVPSSELGHLIPFEAQTDMIETEFDVRDEIDRIDRESARRIRGKHEFQTKLSQAVSHDHGGGQCTCLVLVIRDFGKVEICQYNFG